jgi:carbamoyltransferase
MAILGINMAYHESAAALVIDNTLAVACEEERFNRVKHGKQALVGNSAEVPIQAIRACLESASITPADVEYIALSFCPALRASRFSLDPMSEAGGWGSESGEKRFMQGLTATPSALMTEFGPEFSGRIVTVPHHLAHAASAYYPSGFEDAAILVADGIGEYAGTAIFKGQGTKLIELEAFSYPDSIGFLWEKLSQYLGFSEYDACKTMGLAAYGDPSRFGHAMAELVQVNKDGTYRVDGSIAQFRNPGFAALERLFGQARPADGLFHPHHYDVAATLQDYTTQVIQGLARRAADLSGSRRLCMAGGVALNCVTNSVLNQDRYFEDLYIPPAPHDAGTAVGAALCVSISQARSVRPLVSQSAFLGPERSFFQLDSLLADEELESGSFDQIISRVVDLLCEEKVVGWYQGRMEFGPRALGNRSLLGDPRSSRMREILNKKVKHREDFRPFAPSVLSTEAARWFEIDRITPSHGYMLFTAAVVPHRADLIPAVLHVDGSARVQIVDQAVNPRYHALISEFARRTGVPMLLNTSFNDSEPIVCTPEDAMATFRKTAIDAVAIGDQLVVRRQMAVTQ